MSPAALLSGARRVVVKVGSSLLIEDAGGVRAAWLAGLADDIVALRKAGKEVVVVSSGAVALGRRHLGLKPSARLDHKQAAAAAGQTLLMQAWEAGLRAASRADRAAAAHLRRYRAAPPLAERPRDHRRAARPRRAAGDQRE